MDATYAKGLYARVNDGTGKFPWVKVEIRRKNPVAVPNATSYFLRYMENGVRKVVPLGKDLNRAFTAWQNHVSDVERIKAGKAPIHRDEPIASEKAADRLTIAEAIQTFITENLGSQAKGKLSARTVCLYNEAAIAFRDQVDVAYMDEITREVLLSHETWLHKHLRKNAYGKRETTVANRFQYLKIFMNRNGIKMVKDRAAREGDKGLLGFDEAPKRPKRATPDMYSHEEINMMLDVASVDEADLIEFFLRLGVRDQEAAHAKWTDIEQKREDGEIVHQLHIQEKPEYDWKPKDKEDRMLPMEERFYLRLMARRERQTPKSELIFPNLRGRPPAQLLPRLKRVAKRAGLTSRPTLHKFRRTFASLMIRPSDLQTVSALLGHSDIRTTALYLAPDLSEARRGLRTAFDGIAEGPLFDNSHEARGRAVLLASDSGPGRAPKIPENTASQSSSSIVVLHGCFEIPRQ